ncbi:MAG: BNR repeat-containing protein [Muribaculaceae bacterium]
MKKIVIAMFLSVAAFAATGKALSVRQCPVAEGYSATSVNTAVFRGSSVVSYNGKLQFTAFYDPEGYVVVAKRELPSADWTVARTPYRGNVSDAHNVISIGVDGEGYLHLSFDHHGHPLRYCRSTAPGALDFGALEPMVGGDDELDVTYPEFYTLPGGDMLFAYRSGRSGCGNLVLNRYFVKEKVWTRLHDVLIDGEGARNAYWQLCVDARGIIHIGWCWRESWLVETNHDICYARSLDGGVTWQRSDGSAYNLPITASTAELAVAVPQNSELINQTSIDVDPAGRPCMATYWRDAGSEVPQFRLVWHDAGRWHHRTVGERTAPFSLSGGGTKMIPVSRPRVLCSRSGVNVLFRDEERGSRVTLASAPAFDGEWTFTDITDGPVGAWEPTADLNLLRAGGPLHVFVQPVFQGDGEKVIDGAEPTLVSIYEIE